MAISRAQLAKELEPGLNALFGMSYDSYDREYEEILRNRRFSTCFRRRSSDYWFWFSTNVRLKAKALF